MPEIGDLVEIRGTVRIREVDSEITDETTGKSTTETTLEHSIVLASVEHMAVEDPDRDAEGEPVLGVGRMLADSSPVPSTVSPSPAAAASPAESIPEPALESVASLPGEWRVDAAAPDPTSERSRPRADDEDVGIEQVAGSVEWRQLQEALSEVTGEGFELATPRTGRRRGTHLRLETVYGPVRVPATAQRRLAELLAAGRLPALVSTSALCCVVIETREWRGQLRAMTDAINSGAIDPVTVSVDGLGPPVAARSG